MIHNLKPLKKIHMANLTFSKNGVPMGRNKSTAENKHSAWTLDEDKYIIKSCAENVTAPEMAAKLGRTAMSIYALSLIHI